MTNADLFTSPAGSRRHWQAHVHAQQQSGLSRAEYCRQHNLSYHALTSQEFGSLWLANLVEQQVDLAGIIDKIVPQPRESNKPSVGEYFVYAVYNRMVSACSKRAMPDCYALTLKRFGLRLAARGGKNVKRRAVVAVARKLAVLLHRLWQHGEVYHPLCKPRPRKLAKAA